MPIELALANCSELALASIAMWRRQGARLRPFVAVHMVGERMMATIDFEAPTFGADGLKNGVVVPLIITLADGRDGDARLRATYERTLAALDLVQALQTADAA